MNLDIQVDGLKHLEEALKAISLQAQRKVMSGALKDSARPMVRAAKSAYRGLGGSGALAQSMGAWQSRKRGRGSQTFVSIEVGPKRSNYAALARYYAYYRKGRGSAKGIRDGIRHGHLVEFGFQHRGGRAVGGRRILSGIVQQGGPAAVQEFGRFLGKRIEREAQRQAARQGGRR